MAVHCPRLYLTGFSAELAKASCQRDLGHSGNCGPCDPKPTWPEKLDAFRTSDLKLFVHQSSAEDWQRRLDGATRATMRLQHGASLHAALMEGGFITNPDHYRELAEVFAETKLVIRHWQCRDESGYQPIRVNADGSIFVHGHAGSWSGPYGANCSPSDVISYWERTKGATHV